MLCFKDLAKINGLEVTDRQLRSIKISWKKTNYKNSKDGIYDISYTKLNSNFPEKRSSTDTKCELYGLSPGTLYTIEVRYIGWFDGKKCSSDPDTVTGSTGAYESIFMI